jgi:hypothetical protein
VGSLIQRLRRNVDAFVNGQEPALQEPAATITRERDQHCGANARSSLAGLSYGLDLSPIIPALSARYRTFVCTQAHLGGINVAGH